MTRRHLIHFLLVILAGACRPSIPALDERSLAGHYYQADSAWYLKNIPFFECADTAIQNVYYYRWKMYRAHIRETGPGDYVITEFINHVAWDREPWCTINAAAMHHIYEGRWLRSPYYVDSYVRYLVTGGNDRRYSESVADAAWSHYLVHGDSTFIVNQLDHLQATWTDWADHFDSRKQLYFIPAMPDATEYTIASIDASGGTAGFDGGDAFRPTLNSYQYGNARAIASIAKLKGDTVTSRIFTSRANSLQQLVQDSLWNPRLQHFTDRFKQDNQYVHYWNFIRGRELAGMAPWYFNLPKDLPAFGEAWRHVTDTTFLLGRYGYRTNEPSYEHYFRQFVWFDGKRGSQWNGPSWPYQSSQTLTAMANLLNNYRQHPVTPSDYVSALRQFTRQHYLSNGLINLVENYDPNAGGPIVHYYWSNHYNHSSFNNLIISGLCGIRPTAGDTLRIHPITDATIPWFQINQVPWRGHSLRVVWDVDGTHYGAESGLRVWVDDVPQVLTRNGDDYLLVMTGAKRNLGMTAETNLALNIRKSGYPKPSASVNNHPDSLYQAIDGRRWFFDEVTNGWSTAGSTTNEDWFQLEWNRDQNIGEVQLNFFADRNGYRVPYKVTVFYWNEGEWQPVQLRSEVELIANATSFVRFQPVETSSLRLVVSHDKAQVFLSELRALP
ncbi:MAG: hypothetical protein K1X47_16525 [Cyclobacteriaceae bacterium]|nr:hypothetical protein [Cyclobacteriaceae bacterium]